jgi:aminoglycoside phosphotransferase (APT) family kinase protein
LVSCERLTGGANQETYRILFSDRQGRQTKLALRRAAGGSQTSQEAINVGLPTEARLFQIAREANVPSPQVLRVFNPDDGLGDGFIMDWLDGETIGSRIVKAPELNDIRPRLAEQCGRILARIHAIDTSTNNLTEMLNTVSPAKNVEDTWARYRELDTPQPMIDYTARWLLDHLPNNPRICLVHNDFRNGNLMVDTSGVIGVLDWEIAHLGDPMRDLGWLCTNSWRFGRSDLPVGGFGDYADLISAYEAESEVKVDLDHLRFWEVFGSFWWAVGCLRMAQQYRDGPDRTVERPAIGRRSSECQVDCVNLLIPGAVEIIASADSANDQNLPKTDELVESVSAFLINDVVAATDGRIKFLSRVASNSLQIVRRELTSEPALQINELRGLQALFQCEDSLGALRWRLVNALRDGQLDLNDVELATQLRNVTVNRLAVDQPKYSGFKTATQGLS